MGIGIATSQVAGWLRIRKLRYSEPALAGLTKPSKPGIHNVLDTSAAQLFPALHKHFAPAGNALAMVRGREPGK